MKFVLVPVSCPCCNASTKVRNPKKRKRKRCNVCGDKFLVAKTKPAIKLKCRGMHSS